jgi:hypothetical protein
VTAQIYQSEADTSSPPNNVFTPLGPAVPLLPPLLTDDGYGTVAHAVLNGLSITVNAETRLILVFSAITTDGMNEAVIGYAGGGVSILIPPP